MGVRTGRAETPGNGDMDTGELDTEALGDIDPLQQGDMGAGTRAWSGVWEG